MLVLGIETSCDETSVALVRDGKFILGVKTYSQIKEHKYFGGVVPEIASRIHVKVLHHILSDLLSETGVSLDQIDLIAATHCPGLIGALLVGVSFGNGLAYSLGKPVVGIHHIEAHIYAAFMSHPTPAPLPALGLVVSGGHTQLVLIQGIGKYKILGTTLDDAVGEAFDKIAKIIGLPYPGGPAIDRSSKEGNPEAYRFPRAMLNDPRLDMSFSGLKTSVLYQVRGFGGKGKQILLDRQTICNLSASAQRAIIEILCSKAEQAIRKVKAKSLLVCGGVAANSELKSAMVELGRKKSLEVLIPPLSLCTDNAAMVAGLAYHKRKKASRWISEVFASKPL